MTKATLDRQAAMEQLIAHALETIRSDPDANWLRLVLRKGFAGFENLSQAQLARELQLRGLQPPIEADDDAATLEDDFNEDWDLSRDLPDGIAPQWGASE